MSIFEDLKHFYCDHNYYPQFITTIGKPFRSKLIEGAFNDCFNDKDADYTFTSIRAEPACERMSSQMLKVMDMRKM